MVKNRKGIAIIVHGTPLSGTPQLGGWGGVAPLGFMAKFARVIFEVIKDSFI